MHQSCRIAIVRVVGSIWEGIQKSDRCCPLVYSGYAGNELTAFSQQVFSSRRMTIYWGNRDDAAAVHLCSCVLRIQIIDSPSSSYGTCCLWYLLGITSECRVCDSTSSQADGGELAMIWTQVRESFISVINGLVGTWHTAQSLFDSYRTFFRNPQTLLIVLIVIFIRRG